MAHIEEIVIATSGEDAFELVFGVAVARVVGKVRATGESIRKVALAHPELAVVDLDASNEALIDRVDSLLADALEAGDERLQALDAIFESLTPRVAKGDKGQFFTPRHVVDFVVTALAPTAREVVVDPACGSGAFLAHARAAGGGVSYGSDIDPRAVRVARLVALSQGRSPLSVVRADGLRGSTLPTAHVVATNPPFAGRADATGFEVATLVRTPERDTLFLERSVDLLRPGGRLGIVLPYNKAAGASFAALRRWLIHRVRVLAIIGLPRETFLPYTSQRTFVLFAKKRGAKASLSHDEKVFFAVSERAGKDSSGRALVPADGHEGLSHDLDDVLAELVPFLNAEGFAS